VPTLEDEVEEQRQRKVAELKKSGLGTPVTPETFAVWQEAKRKIRAEAAKKMVEAEFRKKKGGKGLGILSGRALYEYKKELFVDRDDDELEGPSGTSRQTSAISDDEARDDGVQNMATQVQSDLFLEGDDDDLDDLDED
jgi:DRG Family Regulatory Proteins, Tma46